MVGVVTDHSPEQLLASRNDLDHTPRCHSWSAGRAGGMPWEKTTLSENPNAFVCADPTVVPPADGSPPLPALYTNDFINAGGFDIVVVQATGGTAGSRARGWPRCRGSTAPK